MNRTFPNVFDLLQITLIKLRRSSGVSEDETSLEELKGLVVRTAAELSVRRDPHYHHRHKERLASPGEQPAKDELGYAQDASVLFQDHSEN